MNRVMKFHTFQANEFGNRRAYIKMKIDVTEAEPSIGLYYTVLKIIKHTCDARRMYASLC